MKSGRITGLTLLCWVGVGAWSLWHVRSVIPASIPRPAAFALAGLYLPWMATWLWSIHNLVHQALSSFARKNASPPAADPSIPLAILYTTCDDFDPNACASALRQSHLGARLLVCDDSSAPQDREQIDAWARTSGGGARVIRRADRRGFKAGNLNHAIRTDVTEEFIAVCDADEMMPPEFVSRLLGELLHHGAAFVQGRHLSPESAGTWFGDVLGPSVDVFYRFTLPLRNDYGFVACFGHGMILRRSAWEAVGGFPEIACEDLGFAMAAAAVGLRGRYCAEPPGSEAPPLSYRALESRYRRIVAGTVECFQRLGSGFLRSPKVSFIEKLDMLLTFSTCYLPLAVMVNIVGAIILGWFQAEARGWHPTPWMILFYLVGPLTPVVPLVLLLPSRPIQVCRFAVVGAVAFASLSPVLAFVSLRQTIRSLPVKFVSTGAVGKASQRLQDHLPTIAAGAGIAGLAALLRSPALPFAVAAGLMFASGPLLIWANRRGWAGRAARLSALLPLATLAFLWLAA